MIFSWQLVRNSLFKVAYFSPGREDELVCGQASGTAVCKWVECDPFQDLNLFIFLDVGQVILIVMLNEWSLTTGGSALSHASHPNPIRYTELGPGNPFIYTGTIGLDQGFFFFQSGLHSSLSLSK